MRQEINLYTGKIRTPWKMSPQYTLAVFALVATGISIAEGMDRRQHLKETQMLLSSVADELSSVQQLLMQTNKNTSPITLDASIDNTLDILRKKVLLREGLSQAVSAQLENKASAISPLFIALAKKYRQGLWLTSIRIQRSQGILSLHGQTNNPALISDYLIKLTQDRDITTTGFNFLRLAIPEDNEEKSKKYNTEFIITTDEDEIRDISGQQATATSDQKIDDPFKDSFRLIEQLKKMVN